VNPAFVLLTACLVGADDKPADKPADKPGEKLDKPAEKPTTPTLPAYPHTPYSAYGQGGYGGHGDCGCNTCDTCDTCGKGSWFDRFRGMFSRKGGDSCGCDTCGHGGHGHQATTSCGCEDSCKPSWFERFRARWSKGECGCDTCNTCDSCGSGGSGGHGGYGAPAPYGQPFPTTMPKAGEKLGNPAEGEKKTTTGMGTRMPQAPEVAPVVNTTVKEVKNPF
jgi:hypothetical protein